MAAVAHLEFLVEEPSMEAFLRALLPRLLPQDCSFEVHAFQGKHDLLGKLEARLKGYAAWLPEDWRIVVVVDRDDEDCHVLKRRMESLAQRAGLRTRTQAATAPWQLVNRIAIEELEAWYFGDWAAVCQAYPRVPSNLPRQQAFRDPDQIAGGTWEAFERVMQKHGYFKSGLAKIEAARAIGCHLDPARSASRSFKAFVGAVMETCPTITRT
ncbi:DUF4276 family protein [Sulfuricystis multivorans]|uniref:DUF4276 family protein n=1 Tax=Sulfuricystis multivorans TaxID=2211108 RepID=UPI000F8337B6|nr:DUF4276 family protein [Sulfuricystis multivorans]